MVGSFITRAIIVAVGYVYPAYECYKIVEMRQPELEHLRFWCQYWMIIAVMTVFERLGDVFISWVPMYSEAKLAFIIYLWYPKTMGTTYVYHTLLRPFVAKHESEIDQNLNELSTRAGDIALLWWQRGSGYAQARFYELLQFLASQSNRAQQTSVSTQGAPRAPPQPSTQGPPRGQVPQGVPQSYPPPPPARAAGDGANSQSDRPGQGLYPSLPPYTSGAHLRRQSGSRGLSDDGGDSNHGVSGNQPEKRKGLRSEARSTGDENLPQGVQNTRNPPQADSSWNLSVWLPTLFGTAAPSKKID
ncbi:hypothetical protein KC19_2G220800 [Ceratodon purpureus]|uniref:HVA22-like protein n=1 Tax=Ceratodon purpureus TaxID=3225 RepID=A0A8T0IZJ7_CERPU|nr:hypothetical protein KC19_2G220800 [Ceratodon purpureus]